MVRFSSSSAEKAFAVARLEESCTCTAREIKRDQERSREIKRDQDQERSREIKRDQESLEESCERTLL